MSLFMDRFTQILPQVHVRFGARIRHGLGAEIEEADLDRAVEIATQNP